MASNLETFYNPVGAGVAYAQLTMGDEDDLFFENATLTQWKQSWSKYTPHHAANIYHQFSNTGLGRKNVADMMRSPDMWYTTYILGYFPAIAPKASEGVEDCSYVNAPAIYAHKDLEVKVGSQPLFKIDYLPILVLCDMFGLLDFYAELIGYCKTRKQLKKDAKRNRVLGMPCVGLPFQAGPDTAFNIGSITFHSVKLETNTRPITELIINYGNVATGTIPLPTVVSSNLPIANDSVGFGVAATMVWLSKAERYQLTHGYNETIFKEILLAGESTIDPSTKAHRVAFEVDMKGPVTYYFVVIQKDSDVTSHNWTKFCDDDGSDYISEMMLITGTTAREDGLAAPFYRIAKPVELFGRAPSMHVYFQGFETDSLSKQMTGHQNMTNAEKLKFSALYNPHSEPLNVRVYYAVYNGWYTEQGTGGKVWG